MSSDECVIEADGVRRRYAGGFEAVTGISFSVVPGEIFALLGTNGAGKTSTVELLEGLARPDGGTVRVLGHECRAGRVPRPVDGARRRRPAVRHVVQPQCAAADPRPGALGPAGSGVRGLCARRRP
ncbi:ATP-binding cassette domain-containing protein [Streptomyces sp. NPDC005065]|uniref:ATP-binding cassette domain-containing protein n=1 Tax=unclassified Streptomyces TaxID=2593676 RepID=UPI0033A66C95